MGDGWEFTKPENDVILRGRCGGCGEPRFVRVLEGRRMSDGEWYGEVVADRCLCCERPLTEEMVAKALYLVNAPAEGTPWEESDRGAGRGS